MTILTLLHRFWHLCLEFANCCLYIVVSDISERVIKANIEAYIILLQDVNHYMYAHVYVCTINSAGVLYAFMLAHILSLRNENCYTRLCHCHIT